MKTHQTAQMQVIQFSDFMTYFWRTWTFYFIYFIAHIVKGGTNWDFLRFEFPGNFEHKSKIKFDENTEQCWYVGTQRHLCTCPCRHRGHTHRSFCLLSDPTMKTTSYSRQTYHHILCTYTHTRLQNKIIYIPAKNKIMKTNPRKTWHHLRGLWRARVALWIQ